MKKVVIAKSRCVLKKINIFRIIVIILLHSNFLICAFMIVYTGYASIYFGVAGVENEPVQLLKTSTLIFTDTISSFNFPVTNKTWDKQIVNPDFFITLFNLAAKENLCTTYINGSKRDWTSGVSWQKTTRQFTFNCLPLMIFFCTRSKC